MPTVFLYPHVERKFHGYLECGILAQGFAHAQRGQYGNDFLIGFSCKRRGVHRGTPGAWWRVCVAGSLRPRFARKRNQVGWPLPGNLGDDADGLLLAYSVCKDFRRESSCIGLGRTS